jgi:hypothetical protein
MVRYPGGKDFSLVHSVQTGSGVHTANEYRGPYTPGVKQQGREAEHSPPSSIKVKNGGAIPLLPLMPS